MRTAADPTVRTSPGTRTVSSSPPVGRLRFFGDRYGKAIVPLAFAAVVGTSQPSCVDDSCSYSLKTCEVVGRDASVKLGSSIKFGDTADVRILADDPRLDSSDPKVILTLSAPDSTDCKMGDGVVFPDYTGEKVLDRSDILGKGSSFTSSFDNRTYKITVTDFQKDEEGNMFVYLRVDVSCKGQVADSGGADGSI